MVVGESIDGALVPAELRPSSGLLVVVLRVRSLLLVVGFGGVVVCLFRSWSSVLLRCVVLRPFFLVVPLFMSGTTVVSLSRSRLFLFLSLVLSRLGLCGFRLLVVGFGLRLLLLSVVVVVLSGAGAGGAGGVVKKLLKGLGYLVRLPAPPEEGRRVDGGRRVGPNPLPEPVLL